MVRTVHPATDGALEALQRCGLSGALDGDRVGLVVAALRPRRSCRGSEVIFHAVLPEHGSEPAILGR